MNIGRRRRHRAPVGCSPSGRPGPKSAGCCRLTTSVGWTPALESPFGYSPLCSVRDLEVVLERPHATTASSPAAAPPYHPTDGGGTTDGQRRRRRSPLSRQSCLPRPAIALALVRLHAPAGPPCSSHHHRYSGSLLARKGEQVSPWATPGGGRIPQRPRPRHARLAAPLQPTFRAVQPASQRGLHFVLRILMETRGQSTSTT